jgi:hypothetical protein
MGASAKTIQLSGLPIPLSRGNLTGKRKWVVLVLLLVPLASIAVKCLDLPGADLLTKALTLSSVPPEIQGRLGYVLFVPLGAVMVVFFRITLGIRLLGPFRSILLAVAFQVTGIPLGLLFLGIVVGVVVAIRPLLRAIRLPYFARVSTTLSAVAAIMMVSIVAGQALHVDALHRVAYFPIVVLCLTGDGFARTLRREGFRSALWRGAMTALVAVLISAVSSIRGFQGILVRYPELLVLEIGLIIVLSEFFGYRLFGGFNPAPKKSGRRKRRKKKSRKLKVKATTKRTVSPPGGSPAAPEREGPGRGVDSVMGSQAPAGGDSGAGESGKHP